MRKLSILLSLAILLSGGVAIAYQEASDPGIKEASGGTVAQGVKVYQLVRNPNAGANDATFVSTDVVLWDTISDDGVTVNKTTDLGITTSTDAVAGVVVGEIPSAEAVGVVNSAADDLGNRNWGYIQTYGVALAKSGEVQVGGALGAGPVAVRANRLGAIGTQDGTSTLGFALDAVASTQGETVIEVFVRTR